MARDDHNKMLIDRIKGVPARKASLLELNDQRNPNIPAVKEHVSNTNEVPSPPLAEKKGEAAFNARDFDTILSGQFEGSFQIWKKAHAPDDHGHDYDWRGAFIAGCVPNDKGHWPDLFKKPNHPTFSNESIYARRCYSSGGAWDGDKFIAPAQDWRPTLRHKKRGTEYMVLLQDVRLQTDTPLEDYANLTVYRGKDGQLWARSHGEMSDGRFECLAEQKRVSLSFELTKTKAERDRWHTNYLGVVSNASGDMAAMAYERDELQTRLSELEAENAKLRDALEQTSSAKINFGRD